MYSIVSLITKSIANPFTINAVSTSTNPNSHPMRFIHPTILTRRIKIESAAKITIIIFYVPIKMKRHARVSNVELTKIPV